MLNLFEVISIITTVVTPIAALILGIANLAASRRKDAEAAKRLVAFEVRAEQEPQKAKPAWDLARATLEAYFNRNLTQVTAIFWLCVAVMVFGFGIILWGIQQAITNPSSTLPAVITGLSGIITELIGATFLFIYRSTMAQAASYTVTLERINSVGMAMQILDTMPNKLKLKDTTKAAVVKILMQQGFSHPQSKVDAGNPPKA